MNKILKRVLTIGPGIFAIGYTIGTGSVTSMIVAGNQFGMQLLWVLFFSCTFSWVLMEAYGRYTLVTGETALFGFRKHLKYGKLVAILIIVGITFGQWNSLIGILGISSNIIYETFALFFPALTAYSYWIVLGISIVIIGGMYGLLWIGKYSFFEKILVIFVTLMGLSFVFSLFVVVPSPTEVLKGFIPRIPEIEGGRMLVAAFVGTTMAAATFLSRPIFIKAKGWTMDNMKDQRRDARSAAILIFIISGSIMAVSMAVSYGSGTITKVLDMVNTLEPVAGKFALTVFFLGTLSAGISSIFPILMITPILIADYQSGKVDTNSTQFKVIAGIASVISLWVAITGVNPIQAQILSQVFNVFVLPLVILGMLILINQSRLGVHKAGKGLNLGMATALIFACIISYNGMIAIIEKFN